MTVVELTRRVEALEHEFAEVKRLLQLPPPKHWLERVRGRWAGDPVFQEIIELGRLYREAERLDQSAGEVNQ